VIVVSLTPQSSSQESDLLLDRELRQEPITGWFKSLLSHDVYSYRSTIATVICTPELVFLLAETTDFPLVFATSSPPVGMLVAGSWLTH
jgi:hypothetical protein